MGAADIDPPERHYCVALFGPSYVGKSTFLSKLASHPGFSIAPLIADRPPRGGEDRDGVAMKVLTASNFDRQIACSSWFVFRSGGYRYGLDLGAARALRGRGHVILGLSAAAAGQLRGRLPDLVRVLMWPADFDSMQAALLRCPHRSSAEKLSRYDLNQRMRSDVPAADVVLAVPRMADEAMIRAVHHGLIAQLQDALANLSEPSRRRSAPTDPPSH